MPALARYLLAVTCLSTACDRTHDTAQLIGVVRPCSIVPLETGERFIVDPELGDGPGVVVTYDGTLPSTVCDHAHSDVFATGNYVSGGRFEASSVEGFNNHRYDPTWTQRCTRHGDEPHFE